MTRKQLNQEIEEFLKDARAARERADKFLRDFDRFAKEADAETERVFRRLRRAATN